MRTFPFRVVVPATFKFEVTERCPTVVLPTTDRVLRRFVAPPTDNVPVMAVFPVTETVVTLMAAVFTAVVAVNVPVDSDV